MPSPWRRFDLGDDVIQASTDPTRPRIDPWRAALDELNRLQRFERESDKLR